MQEPLQNTILYTHALAYNGVPLWRINFLYAESRLGQFRCANSNPGTSTESVSANWEIFVNPEQLNRGLLVRYSVLFSNSATYGLRGFSKPDTFQDDILRLLLRCTEPVRILWGVTFIFTLLLLFSCSVMSDALRPHGLQHTIFPCPSLPPRVCSDSGPLRWRLYLTISSSVPLVTDKTFHFLFWGGGA